ncbi:DUF2165 family protein [Loktanella sp. IMCC34160]|uniref:DUF2165 family protein n=1 Tax=Loktanella sp. IMCC34160 TaxID=2510646 RepID=UPI00101C683B|nr:DUF2165 family protein [Loktanella sp. IMCC34160]RYG90319.1 DUF2165 family protein [Loktanella sp. IMCC34160]
MFDTLLFVVAAVNLGFMAAWLTIGALENLFHPFLNETYTAQVMDMELMREEYPEAYVHVAHRRLTNPTVLKLVFRAIVAWELAAMLGLWIATGVCLAAAFGVGSPTTALEIGLVASTLFLATWAGFLVAGNYFCYWFGHEGGQNTHFQMLQWGLLVQVLLVAMYMYLT